MKINQQSLLVPVLFFLSFAGMQFYKHGKMETIDFIAGIILAVVIFLGINYLKTKQVKK
ncbi:MAG: hypothetical protein Q7R95_06975 [bacterium]|nr:hypothetical protein [bacterium]